MEALAHNTLRRAQWRFFSGSGILHDTVNELLSLLDQPVPPKSKKSKRILILQPDQTKDKVITRFMSERKSRKRSSSYRNLDGSDIFSGAVFQNKDQPYPDIVEAIEQLRPKTANLLPLETSSLGENIAKGFTKSQMLEYLQKKVDQQAPTSYTKRRLGEYIVSKVWNLQVGEYSPVTLLKDRLPISKEERFYLLSQKGYIFQLLKSAVSSLDFNSDKSELIFCGTETQILNAKVNMNAHLASVHKEEVDFTALEQLYVEKFGCLAFMKIGKEHDVYFSRLLGHRYQLGSLERQNVERIKRMLVWYLDYNLHQKDTLHLPSEADLSACSLIQHADPLACSWDSRYKAQFRLVDERTTSSVSSRLRTELELFSQINLEHLDPLEDPWAASRVAETMEDNTFDLIEKLEILQKDMLGKKTVRDDPIKEAYPPGETCSSFLIPQSHRDALYSELCDFSYRQKLYGMKETELDNYIFTVTLGKTTFSKEKGKKEIFAAPPSKETLSKEFHFDTNLPLLHDRALSRMNLTDSLDFQEDPYQYQMQFKFLPSPYSPLDPNDLREQIKYPPIELWASLNEKSILELDSVKLVTVEGENNAHVCLPAHRSDLKISCQITGHILDPTSPPSPAPQKDSNVLEAVADKFGHLWTQPGVQEFLRNLTLDFSGNIKPSIAPTMNVVIDGTEVEYTFISVRHRRELTLKTDEDMTVQLSVVDGGLMGGRRLEVRLIGDYAAGLSRENFDKLLDHSFDFIRSL